MIMSIQLMFFTVNITQTQKNNKTIDNKLVQSDIPQKKH